jgi:transcription antitermination factor NusA-like protein
MKGVLEKQIKSKVAVESYDDRIDPVGTCVGAKVVELMVLYVN